MGYRTKFSIYVHSAPEDRKAILDDIEKTSGYSFDERDDDNGFAYLSDSGWGDCQKDLTEVSARHPDAIIECNGEGEDRDDSWSARYRAGLREERRMEQTMPPFQEILTDREKAAKTLAPSDAVAGLKDCHDILERVLRSRHAAFCSPSPSSTEAAVRKSVRQAANLLDITLSLLRA